MRIVVTLVATAVAVVVLHAQGTALRPQPYRDINNITHASMIQQVQDLCDKAHGEINGASERACGEAQAVTQTEYICSSVENNAVCWVEVQ